MNKNPLVNGSMQMYSCEHFFIFCWHPASPTKVTGTREFANASNDSRISTAVYKKNNTRTTTYDIKPNMTLNETTRAFTSTSAGLL